MSSLTGRSAAKRGTARITRAQIALIHVAKHQCNIDEADYRKLLSEAAGVDSSSALNAKGFRFVMERFKLIGFASKSAGVVATPRPAPMGRRAGMATAAQVELVSSLWARYAQSPDPRSLGRWLERSYGVSDIRFATTHTASIAIEGLKAMLGRAATKAAEPAPISDTAKELT